MGEMGEIIVKQLGLAAYVHINGGVLLRVDSSGFIFQSSSTLEEWRVRYNNSCCMKHDSMVCELRHFLK